MGTNKKTFHRGPFKEFAAQAVQVDNLIFLSGQVAIDEAGNTPESFAEQTKVVYRNVRSLLVEFGASMSDIVDETVFVTDMPGYLAEIAEVREQRAAAFGGRPESTQTLVQTGALVRETLKIEIKCIAHVQGSSDSGD